jgi:tRNA pseudouridine55 synthase
MTSGILVVDKPLGATSFDMVRRVRRGTGEKRVGHAGTLDPAATGVLLVLLGQATRITEYLMDMPKTYKGTVRLGVSTTTYDAEGQVTGERDASDVAEAAMRDALAAFVGEIEQVPPAHSAVKVEGERAYHRARRGEAVALKARPASIYSIDLLRYDPPRVEIQVECGRGTYIRSLAHDIGERLGCGAHLASLVRTRVGPFSLDAAADGEALEAALADGSWRELLQPMDGGLTALPAITLEIEDEKDIRHGQPTDIAGVEPPTDGTEARGYAEDGSLVGIIRFDAESGMWRPRKVFPPEAANE